MKWYLFAFVALGMGCHEVKEKSLATKDTVAVERKYFSGKPDLPGNDFEITSSGIGKLRLGDSMSAVDLAFDSVTSISVYERGIEWPGKKVVLPDGYWIIAEAVNTVDIITHLRANHPSIRTREGYHAGMPVDSILPDINNIIEDKENKAFLLGTSSAWFKITPVLEKKYFSKKGLGKSELKAAKVHEIFIVCGDC